MLCLHAALLLDANGVYASSKEYRLLPLLLQHHITEK